MITKRILVPVLALAALGLPARASVAAYCDSYCGLNTTAAFNSIVAADAYTYASATDLTFTGSLTGGGLQYLDGMTQVLFAASSAFTITGTALEAAANGAITITVPAQYAVIRLSLSQTTGGSDFTCIDSSCNSTYLTSTPTEVDYINTAPGSLWSVTISTGVSGERITVNRFNPAGAAAPTATPEVGTLLLIGFGLISMRWMNRLPRLIFRTPRTA